MKRFVLAALVLGLMAVTTRAQSPIAVTSDIAVSTTWTANNVYDLRTQIYVLPGATLTIEAGTVVATSPIPGSSPPAGGSLAVARGAKIVVKGTAKRPVIMTSSADRATWTANNPKTGTWRESANEWGNLTIMGSAYISEDAIATNSASPSGSNVGAMEGLTAAFPGDPNVLYGGADDDDDSGSIAYLSLRYGGRVIGLNNELNGISLGGIGRETDIHHIEIMNNVDDGFEIWGGTVNIRNFSIWNIGDDSFDVDQGWRGRAQFGLIVQGYSLNASQGSGVGDNCFEIDGAEDSDYQPVTTATIYNCTVIGQPADGDGATVWRDNANVQYRNCIFMDCGENVVRFDNVDGDGANGYGFNGTMSWPARWTTPYTTTSTVNAPANPADFYKAQFSGNLCEIKDSVFYNNANYAEAMNIGGSGFNIFTAPGNNNVFEPTNSPIQSITRGAPVNRGGKIMLPVIGLDPRPANDALVSVAAAPSDSVSLSSARYRGAFAPGANWLDGWTASSAFGFTATTGIVDLGNALGGTSGDPIFSSTGTATLGTPVVLTLSNARPNAVAYLIFGFGALADPFLGIVPDITQGGGIIELVTLPNGTFVLPFTWPFPAGIDLYGQWAIIDLGGAPYPLAISNALGFISQ